MDAGFSRVGSVLTAVLWIVLLSARTTIGSTSCVFPANPQGWAERNNVTCNNTSTNSTLVCNVFSGLPGEMTVSAITVLIEGWATMPKSIQFLFFAIIDNRTMEQWFPPLGYANLKDVTGALSLDCMSGLCAANLTKAPFKLLDFPNSYAVCAVFPPLQPWCSAPRVPNSHPLCSGANATWGGAFAIDFMEPISSTVTPLPLLSQGFQPLLGFSLTTAPTCSLGSFVPAPLYIPRCIACSAGSFSQTTNARECLPCGGNSYSTQSAGACTACAFGRVAPQNASSAALCQCSIGYFNTSTSDTPCLVCPVNAKCPGGGEGPVPLPGFLEAEVPFVYIGCPMSWACINGNCAPHYEGHLCSTCVSGYAQSDLHYCQPCGSHTLILLSLYALVVVFIFVALVVLLRVLPFANESERTFAAVVGTERCHVLRRCGRGLASLWQETTLVVFQILLVVGFSAAGIGSVWQIAATVFAAVSLSAYLFFHKKISYKRDVALDELSQHRPPIATNVSPNSNAFADATRAVDRYDTAMAKSGVFASVQRARGHIESTAFSFIIFLQSAGAMTALLQYRLLPPVRALNSLLSHVNVHISGLACVNLGFTGSFLVLLAFVPVFSVFVLAVYCLRRMLLARERSAKLHRAVRGDSLDKALVFAIRHHYDHAFARLRCRAQSFVLVVWYFFLFPVSQQSLSIFDCATEQVPGAKTRWMTIAPWIACRGPAYRRLVLFASLALTGVVVSIFIAAPTVVRAVYSTQANSPWTFLYRGYRPEAYWFGGVVLARRLATAAATSVLPITSGFFLPAIAVILTLAGYLQNRWWPLRESLTNVIELLSMFGLLVCAAIIQSLIVPSQSDELLTSALIASILGVACLYMGAVLWPCARIAAAWYRGWH
eukprot:c6031_g1_i1.p1 GENE.c6031_g1_i1~~c6031_g1_i1.p1  ORF type:complete len:886 (-),score=46.20 c6031_g1_i1:389-3046(-)